jgi:hypothetical protein
MKNTARASVIVFNPEVDQESNLLNLGTFRLH